MFRFFEAESAIGAPSRGPPGTGEQQAWCLLSMQSIERRACASPSSLVLSRPLDDDRNSPCSVVSTRSRAAASGNARQYLSFAGKDGES